MTTRTPTPLARARCVCCRRAGCSSPVCSLFTNTARFARASVTTGPQASCLRSAQVFVFITTGVASRRSSPIASHDCFCRRRQLLTALTVLCCFLRCLGRNSHVEPHLAVRRLHHDFPSRSRSFTPRRHTPHSRNTLIPHSQMLQMPAAHLYIHRSEYQCASRHTDPIARTAFASSLHASHGHRHHASP